MDARYFAVCLDEMVEACDSIKDADLCEHCPMKGTCIEETPFIEIALDVPRDNFEELVKMGENPEWYILSDDQRLEIAYKNR